MSADDSLPDVSFADDHRSTNHSNSNSPIKTANYGLEKVTALLKKQKDIDEHLRRKLELSEKIGLDEEGYLFDSGGVLKPHVLAINENDLEGPLDPEHEQHLNQMRFSQHKPIQIVAELKELFKLENIDLNLYEYTPLEKLKDKYFTSVRVDSMIFFKTFNKSVLKEDEKDNIMNCLILNVAFHTNLDIIEHFEIIESIFESEYFKASKWYLSPSILFELFKNMGFDLTDLKEIVDNLPGSDSYSKLIVAKKAKVLLEKDKVYFAVLKIADLIYDSIRLKKSLYTEKELDALFVLIICISYDKIFEASDIRKSIEKVVNALLDCYNSENFDEKLHNLSMMILNIAKSTEINKISLENQSNNNNQSQPLKNDQLLNSYHRVIHFVKFLQNRKTQRSRDLNNKLSFVTLNDLLEKFECEHDEDINQTNNGNVNFAKIVDLLEKRCHKMYSSSSYCMYIIIELLFTIFIHNFSDHQEELSANINILFDIKKIIEESDRRVRDTSEDYEARAQVKLLIKTFVFSCEFLMKKYDLPQNKDNGKKRLYLASCENTSK